jgi:hypothetical protein
VLQVRRPGRHNNVTTTSGPSRCSFLWAAPAPAPAYDDYDARTTTGAFTASPTPSLLDPPWAWSTEAPRMSWVNSVGVDNLVVAPQTGLLLKHNRYDAGLLKR